jgi:molybdate transport system regulatory protein
MYTRPQVCQALGISAKTLYLWERQGRIPPPRRTARGWRAYGERDVARLRALLGRPAPPAASGPPALPVERLSARNQLRGTVVSVRGDRVLCEVVLRLGDGQEVSAVITRRSAERLGLRRGAEATAVIKATEVMLFR